MFNKEKQSDNNIFLLNNTKLNENCQKIVQDAVSELNIVGFMTGYYDENLTITQVSSHMLKNLGYTFEEFQKKTSGSLRNLFYGENQTFLEYDRFQRLQGCGEGQMLMSDGTPVFVRMCKKDAIADDGKQVWVLSVQIDWMQQNLKLINNVIHSAMWRFDCDKSGNIKEVYWSHEFRTMLGYHDILDFPNKLESWADLLHPEDKEATLTLLEQAIQDKTDSVKYDCEYRLKMKDGSYQWFRANAETTRRLDGTVRLIVGTFINIDKRKQSEMKAQRNEAFHRAYTEGNICEYYVNLKDNSFESLKVEDSLLDIFEKSHTWDELIQAYLDNYVVDEDKEAVSHFYNRNFIVEKLSEGSKEITLECRIRIENGKIELTEEDFNLDELVDNLIAMTRSEIEAHHHNFEVQLNKIEHEYVRGDSLRVQQIFTNIMSNAIKYTPDGGKILFSITEKPTTSLDIGCYEFVIQDNGMGMSEEFQKVMFDPFTREDDKRISEIQGTGLGMAITRNIVNMMNGNIKVESKLGKGSRFTVTIFLRLRDEKSETIDELVNLPVLVVDDDKICCEGTVATLNEIGIDGEWVLSGKEAVERAVKRHENGNDYFVYIIDWQMPGMDGIETTRQIRQKIGPDVSVIVLTSYDYTKIEEEAKAAGVDEFISKPLFRSRLTAALQKIISGKPSQDARDYLKNIAASDYTGKKILLVEDNELNREVAAEIIGMTGAEIETAVNGKEAVDKVADHPNGYYDLVFMDVQMPIMNGYEAATAIRSLPKHKGELLPIVAMTANAFTEDVILAKSAGMNEHIAKPLDMEKLNRMLHEWM